MLKPTETSKKVNFFREKKINDKENCCNAKVEYRCI